MGKPESERPLGRPTSRWEHIINMDLREVGCGVVDGTNLLENRDLM